MTCKKALTTIYIDESHPQLNNECRISIRITFDRRRKYYSTPYSLTAYEFYKELPGKEIPKEKLSKKPLPKYKKTKAEYKDIALELQAYEKKADAVIKKLSVFTWDLFEKHFLTNRIENDTIQNAFEKSIYSLKISGQIGTAVSYGCAKKSLENFNAKIRFTDVTPEFLRKYESWMIEKGKSLTTVSMYLRHLRTIFNNAISDELIPKEIYPFGKKRYEIPTGKNVKKAMPLSDISLIYHYEIEQDTTALFARDIWLFIYFCNGMNMKDVSLLKYKNIDGDFLSFERAKTKRTKRNVEPIRVSLTVDVQRIIDTHGNKDKGPSNYIFPILKKGISLERERQLIQQATHVVNDHMKIIAEKLDIKKNVTTYTARHSFATILQRSGVSTSFISEALGHSNVQTTQNYLAGFEDDQKKETAKILSAFKK